MATNKNYTPLIYLGLGLPALIVFWPILFGGQVFADTDALLQTYPAAQFLQQSLQSGDSFLWTPQVLTGSPMASSFLGGFFSPLYQLLFKNFDVFLVYNWLTCINFILAGWMMYGLCRKIKLSRSAAFLAGLVLPMSTAYWLFGANLTVTTAYWLLPGLLMLVLHLKDINNKFIFFITSITSGCLLGLIMLQAHPQWPLMAATIAGVLGLILFIKNKGSKFYVRLKPILGLAIAYAIGLIIALKQYLPALEQGNFSARSSGISYSEAALGSLKFGDLSSFLFPNLYIHQIIGKPGFLYIGSTLLVLAIISIWIKKDFNYRFFAGTFLTTLAIAIVGSPLFWIIHQLPIFNSFREPARFMYIGLMALIILAAYGFDTIAKRENFEKINKAVKWLWKVMLMLMGLLIIWQVTVWIWGEKLLQQALNYFDANLYAETTQLPLSHYHNVISNLYQQLINGTTAAGILFTIGFLSLIATITALFYWTKKQFDPRILSTILIMIAAINMIGINVIRAAYVPRQVATKVPEFIDELIEQNKTFRVWGFLIGPSIYQKLDIPYGKQPEANAELHRALFNPNSNIGLGLDSLNYYDDLMDRRHARILAYVGSNRSTFGENLAESDLSFREKTDEFLNRLDMLSVFNVKYILSLYPLDSADLRLFKETEVTEFSIPLYIYENPNALPRYYLTNNVVYSEILPEEQSWQTFLENQGTILEKPLLECNNCGKKPEKKINPPVAINPIFKDNDEFKFQIEAEGPQWLIIGHNKLPGWQAYINGEETEIYLVNFINQAVYIPKGDNVVKLIYAP